MGVQVAYRHLLMEFMGCSSVKSIGIRDRTVRGSRKVADDVVDILELCFVWGSSITRETFDGVHDIRAGILHNMYILPICALNFAR